VPIQAVLQTSYCPRNVSGKFLCLCAPCIERHKVFTMWINTKAQQVRAGLPGGRRSADVHNPPDSLITSSPYTPSFPPTPFDRHHCKHLHDVMGAKSTKAVETEPPKLGKSGKKICCSCPETKKVCFHAISSARRRGENSKEGESGLKSGPARIFSVRPMSASLGHV